MEVGVPVVSRTAPPSKLDEAAQTALKVKVEALASYSREELLGQDHRIISSGYHSKEFIRDLWTTIASGGVWLS